MMYIQRHAARVGPTTSGILPLYTIILFFFHPSSPFLFRTHRGLNFGYRHGGVGRSVHGDIHLGLLHEPTIVFGHFFLFGVWVSHTQRGKKKWIGLLPLLFFFLFLNFI